MFPVIKDRESGRPRSGITWFNPAALPLFEGALARGSRRRLVDRMLGRSWRLLALRDVLSPDMVSEALPGVTQVVELDAIRGSVNRSDDFDRRFYPLTDRLSNRWVRIASMTLQNTALPPVELIRVRDLYFVVDGHHRISVSRMLDYATVDAVISQAYD
ncbi:MAG: hypothetical protein IT319_19415 [Anaerolineae bacterium]|nr:hypothetical protein [Anaerolineae bacterium]